MNLLNSTMLSSIYIVAFLQLSLTWLLAGFISLGVLSL